MIDEIIHAIAQTLEDEFGDDCPPIYDNVVPQGLNEPCFSILCLETTHTPFRLLSSDLVQPITKKQIIESQQPRYYQKNLFCIYYFPDLNDTTPQTTMFHIKEHLTGCLEYIEVGDDKVLLRGTDMNSKENDGILNFFVNYNAYVDKVITPPDTMGDLTHNERLKG